VTPLTDLTEPGPGTDLPKGEEDLRLALNSFLQGSDAHREQFFETLDAAVGVPLRKVFAGAHEAHDRLREEAGLGTSTGDVEADAKGGTIAADLARRGRRFHRYRDGVLREVLEPLLKSLRTLEVGETVGARWTGFVNGLPGLADTLPDLLVREEPADLYGFRAGDGRVTSLRKGVIRAGRGIRESVAAFGRWLARLVGRAPKPPQPRTQQVPLRPLTRDILLLRYPLALKGISDSLQEFYARPVARLGAALARWTDEWFDAEVRAQAEEGRIGARFRDEILRGIPDRTESRADPPGEDPGEAEEDGEEAQPVSSGPSDLHEISRGLSEALQSAASMPPPVEWMERVKETMEGEREFLLEAVRVAGSFQETSPSKRTGVRVRRLIERDQAQADAWQTWHVNTLERILLSTLLLKLRDGFDQTEDALRGRIVEEALAPLTGPWKEALTGLRALGEKAEAIFSALQPGADPSALASEVDTLRSRAQGILDSDLMGTLIEVRPDEVIHQVADEVSSRLSDSLRFLPDSVEVAPLHVGTGRISPTQSVKDLPFRETVHQTLDVLTLESIRNSPGPLLSFLETADTACVELPSIVSYNLSMAAEELRSPPEDSPEKVVSDARSLTTDGLTRTADLVEDLLENLAGAWMEFTGSIHTLLEQSFDEIHTRAMAEGAVEDQILGIRSWIRSLFRTRAERGRIALRWANRKLRVFSRRAWILGTRLVRLGKSAVGVQVGSEGEGELAMEALRQVPDLLESLPLVYRRLFSLSPVADPGLLVGREAELAWVGKRLERWKAGFGKPCILTGPVGVGHTSFLNVLEATRLKDCRTRRMDLDRRIRTEEELSSLLAKTLGFEDPGPWTLAMLARQLLATPPAPEKPLVVLVEHLEHLLLRVPGGTDLMEDFISFQALTSKRVFWLSTTSGASWKLLEKNEPSAAGLLDRRPLPPLSRGDTEKAILVRHRRSGLPLEFVQPTELNPLIRRRLRLSRSEKARQEIIRADYFDRISRSSENSLTLAMLTWLRSTDFATREGRLMVCPASPIRFSFLDELDLSLDFALKAFLEHGSLTPEEYQLVFNAPEEEAFQVFEALRARLLIHPAGPRGEAPSGFNENPQEERYRVRPLLSQVVAGHLMSRNILH
jgi:hypothetical protein